MNFSIYNQNVTIQFFPETQNSSSGCNDQSPGSKITQEILSHIFLICTYLVMFTMGCEVRWEKLKEALLSPKCTICGITGQYLLMPLCGFLSVKIFSIEGVFASAVMIVACSPGGGFSNLITYLFDGDVPISVVLTTFSNVIAFGAMPLNLWIYSQVDATGIVIPYVKMVVTLILLNVALAFGLLIRWKAPRIADYILKIGATSLSVISVVSLFTWVAGNVCYLRNLPSELYYAVVFILATGYSISALAAYLCKFPATLVKTLSIETSTQSVGTAFAIAIISFDKKVLKNILIYIFVYTIISSTTPTIFGGMIQLRKCFIKKNDIPRNYAAVTTV